MQVQVTVVVLLFANPCNTRTKSKKAKTSYLGALSTQVSGQGSSGTVVIYHLRTWQQGMVNRLCLGG